MKVDIGNLLASSPNVCGGRLRIEGTRITVNQIAVLCKEGLSAEEISKEYPHLSLAQIYASLAYYYANQEEMEKVLQEEEEEGKALKKAFLEKKR
jgi:uncharacterized protein (DUF433 family)